MAGYFLIGVLAAIGGLSVLWALLGWLLPVCRKGWLLYPAGSEQTEFVPVYLWLRSLGLVKCPLILVDLGLSQGQRERFAEKGIEIYSLEELPERLGIGAKAT